MRHCFNGVVHCGVNVFSHQLNRHVTAPFERDVDHFFGSGFFNGHRDDLVFLFGARSSHFEFARFALLDGLGEVAYRFVR